MLIVKDSGTEIDNLQKSWLDYLIDNSLVVALVERDLTFTDGNKEDEGYITSEYIDDITESEVEEGLKFLKQWCVSNGLESKYLRYMNKIGTKENELENLKNQKLYEVKEKKIRDLENGILYKGHTFQTRESDKLNINGAVTSLTLDMNSSRTINEVVWIDKDDVKVTFTPEEFLDFASKVALNTQEIIFQANTKKEQIRQAVNVEEMNNISI